MHVSKKFHATFLLALFFNSSLLFSAVSHPPSPARPLSPDSAELFEKFNTLFTTVSRLHSEMGPEADKIQFGDTTLTNIIIIWSQEVQNFLKNPNPGNKAVIYEILSSDAALTALLLRPMLDLIVDPKKRMAQNITDWTRVLENLQKLPDMTPSQQLELFQRDAATLERIGAEYEEREETKAENMQNFREKFQKDLEELLETQRAQFLVDPSPEPEALEQLDQGIAAFKNIINSAVKTFDKSPEDAKKDDEICDKVAELRFTIHELREKKDELHNSADIEKIDQEINRIENKIKELEKDLSYNRPDLTKSDLTE